VFLTRIDSKAADSTFKPVWQGDAAPVWWRYQGENPEAGKPRTLGPPADLDLCYAIRDHLGGRGPALHLRLGFIPVNLAPLMEIRPNEPVILYFEARSDEVDSETLRVKVAWNGQWSEDNAEMAGNLTIDEA
jgi:hypothetical protein